MAFDGKCTPGEILAEQVRLLGEVTAAVSSSVSDPRAVDEIDGDELMAALRTMEKARRVLHSADAKVHATLADRQRKRGRSDGAAAKEAAEGLNLTDKEVRDRINSGRRSSTSGGKAHAKGEISGLLEKTIASIMQDVSDRVSDADKAKLERELVTLAREGRSPKWIRAHARRRLQKLDAEYNRHAEERQQMSRSLVRGRTNSDNISPISITSEPRLRALIDTVVAKFGRPGQCISAPIDPVTGEPADMEVVAAGDTRTPAQRAYDALCHVLALGLADGVRTPQGAASILVRVTPEELDDPGSIVTTEAGTDLSVAQAVSMAGHAPWFVELIREGRAELHKIDVDKGAGRIATYLQRLWLFAAHGGCTFPGCEVPAANCEFDHGEEYWKGGPTTVANGQLCCPIHHRRKGDLPHQWKVEMQSLRPGKPRWIPPVRSRHAGKGSGRRSSTDSGRGSRTGAGRDSRTGASRGSRSGAGRGSRTGAGSGSRTGPGGGLPTDPSTAAAK